MAIKYTPGPWEWQEDKWNGGYAGLHGPDGQSVLYPCHRNDGDTGDAWFDIDDADSLSPANARLIVAAPDLLEALRELLESSVYAEGEGLVSVGEENHSEHDEVVARARAAIAKAVVTDRQ